MVINIITKAVMQSPHDAFCFGAISYPNWGSLYDRLYRARGVDWYRVSARVAMCVTRFCVCTGRSAKPGDSTWITRTQASGPITATSASSASLRSPASIFIRGLTQVGVAWHGPLPRRQPLLQI